MNRKKLRDFFCGGRTPVLMGPTASGKSSLALMLAESCGGEIVSADSMQFYRGLDIGTAKASPEERARIPHHLLDTMEIGEKSDVFCFLARADSAIQDIRRRGKRPVIAGGSGLYLHALIYGLDDLPARQSLRDELDRAYDNDAHFPELVEIMKKHCPGDCRLFSAHRRKLIRAYEVFLLSGKQFSELRKQKKEPREDLRSFLLVWDRTGLRERIAARTVQMLDSGWIPEARRLISQGLLQSPTAWQAIGYAQIGEYLAGKISRKILEEKIITATWQFARRQLTWFAHQHPEAEIVQMPCEFF